MTPDGLLDVSVWHWAPVSNFNPTNYGQFVPVYNAMDKSTVHHNVQYIATCNFMMKMLEQLAGEKKAIALPVSEFNVADQFDSDGE